MYICWLCPKQCAKGQKKVGRGRRALLEESHEIWIGPCDLPTNLISLSNLTPHSTIPKAQLRHFLLYYIYIHHLIFLQLRVWVTYVPTGPIDAAHYFQRNASLHSDVCFAYIFVELLCFKNTFLLKKKKGLRFNQAH